MKQSYLPWEIWCGGNYNLRSALGGTGWIIRRGTVEDMGGKAMPRLPEKDRAHGPDIAQTLAVAEALEEIPDGSYVYLQLDCEDLVEWLDAKKITTEGKQGISPLQKAFARVLARIEKMADFTATQITGRSNRTMDRVRETARHVSTIKAARV